MKHRLELFTDAVLAIIITIMVLDLHSPASGQWRGFLPSLPSIGIYAVGFVLVGTGWIVHHHYFLKIKTINRKLVGANFILLFVESLVPFVVKTWADHPRSAADTTALLLLGYAAALSFTLLRMAAWRDNRDDPEFVAWSRNRGRVAWGSLLSFSVLVLLAQFWPLVALLLYLGTLLWLISTAEAKERG